MFSQTLHGLVGAITSLALSLGLVTRVPVTTPAIPPATITTTAQHSNISTTTPPKNIKVSTTTAQTKITPKQTTTPKPVKKSRVVATPIPAPIIKQSPALPANPVPEPSFEPINQSVRSSLVNIFCRSTEGLIMTGTGTIIAPQGVVLTNAHLGQFFAFEHTNPQQIICWLRTGSPAREAYKASLLYISTKWVGQNAGNQQVEEPSGTGERDFALLLIATSTKSVNLSGETTTKPTPLQSFPPALTYDNSSTPAHQDSVLVAGYSAGFLGASEIERNLYTSSSITKIEDIYTFEETKRPIDLFMLKGSISAQKGTSGGAVVNNKGKLIGIVSIVTKGKTTNERLLGAISLSHITQSFFEETGFTFDEYTSGDYETLSRRAAKFNEFSAKITDILNTKNASSTLPR